MIKRVANHRASRNNVSGILNVKIPLHSSRKFSSSCSHSVLSAAVVIVLRRTRQCRKNRETNFESEKIKIFWLREFLKWRWDFIKEVWMIYRNFCSASSQNEEKFALATDWGLKLTLVSSQVCDKLYFLPLSLSLTNLHHKAREANVLLELRISFPSMQTLSSSFAILLPLPPSPSTVNNNNHFVLTHSRSLCEQQHFHSSSL